MYNGEQNRLPAERCAARTALPVTAKHCIVLRAPRLEVMLWKLELACANAQAQVRRCAALMHRCPRGLSHAKQALAEMQATTTERSLPPPSYADKARAGRTPFLCLCLPQLPD